RIKKKSYGQFFDMVAPAVMLGQMIGRWGNFMNGEAHGGVTDVFCRMGLRFSQYGTVYYYHPTFIYEALWNLVGFILINIFYKKKRYNGQVAYMYLAWYGFGRMFIEQLRTDSLYIFAERWYLKISSLVGLFCFLIFGGLLLYHLIKKTKAKTAFVTDKTDAE
ncbi:MAG: prolipoprotein diacylglyceryl transferase, partial [Clostridia bacterium]|nr:prolipoprotein diacylglyceryl transferase [Clostridia bacterium]